MQFTGAVFIGSLTDISLLEALPPKKKNVKNLIAPGK